MKVALVTGATSGIGRVAATKLATAGWTVAVSGQDRERGEEVTSSLGGRGKFFRADLGDPEEVARLVKEVSAEWRRLDLLVNNAGLYEQRRAGEVTPADYERLMSVNLRAPVLLSAAAIRVMSEGEGGVVVNVSSEAGLVAVKGQTLYNVSKAALVMLTKSIAADHAVDGVRAVTICPGTTRTPLVERALKESQDPRATERALAETRPSGRLGKPEEVASAIVYAASEEAAFINGTEIVVDGGYTAV